MFGIAVRRLILETNEGAGQEGMSSGRIHMNRIIEPLRAPGSRLRASPPALLCGSMTVEAALVLPLFMFFFCNILGFLDMIRLQCVMFAAVREVGTKVCEYAYYLDTSEISVSESGVDIPEGITSYILSETYIRSEVCSYLGEDYLAQSPIVADSLSFLQSDIMNGDDIISIVADYRIEPFIPVIAPHSFSMQTRFVSHAWNGYEIDDVHADPDVESADEEVYITPSGTVYHRDRECTYLRPHVQQTSAAQIDDKRSSNGSRYYPCESCQPVRIGTLYYTTDGNRYHSSAACSQIKRTILTVQRSSVEGSRHACSKCGGGS